MKTIILDCDNTMGYPNCDIDDGLALLYLLGKIEEARLLAITTTYGNSSLDIVHTCTKQLLDRLNGLSGVDRLPYRIPLYKGGLRSDSSPDEASDFLCVAVNDAPGEITILATGSLTNLRKAALKDPAFFEKVKEIYLMGGVTGKLVIGDKTVEELNFTCDPDASLMVLGAPCKVSVATAQHCLPAFFETEEFNKRFFVADQPEGGLFYALSQDWLKRMEDDYHVKGFCCWDVVAAAMIIQPDLFTDEIQSIALEREYLEKGMLLSPSGYTGKSGIIHTPTIVDSQEFCEEMYRSWEKGINKSL